MRTVCINIIKHKQYRLSEFCLNVLILFFFLENSVYVSRFLGFSLYVSNTTKKEDGILCFHDTAYNAGSIPSSMNISCPVSGRYVIYYNTREGNISHIPTYSSEAYIELCEVEVYGKHMYVKCCF